LLPNTPASSSEIKRGSGQGNVIAVLVKGNTISMYVNDLGTPIATVTDPNNVSKQGSIGLIAYAPNSPTTVTYTDALVWTQAQ